MKKIGILGKIIFWSNAVAALLLCLVFLVSYLPPKSFPSLSLVSLAVSPLVLVNVLFALYWILRLKRRALMSISVLALGYFLFGPYYKIGGIEFNDGPEALKVMSFNVRLFNAYEEKPETDVAGIISSIMNEYDPDILCIQEYYRDHPANFSSFSYSYIHFKEDHVLGHAIFSKYPLVNTGGFDFDGTYNNSIFVDAKIGGDTLRVYNLHLQSMGILPSVEYLQDGNKNRLRQRMAAGFVKQQEQAADIRSHIDKSPYPSILSADLNNTPYSYVYRKIGDDFNDAYYESGRGLGTTFSFDSYPLRIDYIFASEEFEIGGFKTIKKTFSDHYPIMATLFKEK